MMKITELEQALSQEQQYVDCFSQGKFNKKNLFLNFYLEK